MPASNQKPAPPTPASPRNTAKYISKDGSKFITVPKGASSDPSQPSTPTANTPAIPPQDPSTAEAPTQPVNRKKQKRRQKAAAKAAAEQAVNGHPSSAPTAKPTAAEEQEIGPSDDEYEYALGDVGAVPPTTNGLSASSNKSKKSKKKKKKHGAGGTDFQDDQPQAPLSPDLNSARASMPPPQGPAFSRDKIWSTSNHEERERIKEFWLGLGEDERKSLVKVEKDAVLKKMKEQQKHTCSCTVCGRKRTAIEEELEGLYDAYYLELEQFANQGDGPPMLPPPRDFRIHPPRGFPSGYGGQPPSRGRIVEHVGEEEDEEELDEVYSDEEVDDDEFSDDEPPEEYHNPHDRDVADFLTFGNSLQVKGGILTVADDLLKNDGKRFIEMMEQLAERRMAREEDAREHFARGYGHPNGSYPNPHHPPPEDDEYEEDEDEEEDYEDSQDEYEDEEDELTEEQRMEEGRRMFQIFAARMFEQRVLSAYKEKVAKERQQQLLEELEEESRQVDEQKAKKAKNAQKKKDKAAQKKQALAEEKARKEAEKLAEDKARHEAEQKRAAEIKQKAEEKKKQKEAQRKAEEDARLKKEADRQRRIHEQQEKQAEQERKAREAREREKKLKDEQRNKEKAAKEQRDKEAQERKDKQDRDKREKEARAIRSSKEAHETIESRGKAKEDRPAQKAAGAPPSHGSPQLSKRAQQHPVSIPTVLPQHAPNPANFASPKIPVATPAIPKAPAAIRPRTLSQQQQPEAGATSSSASQSASLPSQNPSPHPMSPNHTSPRPVEQERRVSGGASVTLPAAPQSVSPPNAQLKGLSQQAGFQMPSMGMHPPPGLTHHQPPPGFPNRMSHDPVFSPPFRPGPNMMMPPPGINGPAARGFPPAPLPPPGFTQATSDPFPLGQSFPGPKDTPQLPTHGRQGSGGFDGILGAQAQPIGRPAPIGRPGSVIQGNAQEDDENPKHLGSRVLVDDDEPLSTDLNVGSLRNQPPGLRGGFGASPFADPGFPVGHSPWGPPAGGAGSFPPPGFGNPPGWGAPSMPHGFNMASPVPGMASIRSTSQPRHVAFRLMLCQAYKDLSRSGSADADGFVDIGMVKSHIDTQYGDSSATEQDLLDLCDTEGSPSNGGGAFDLRANSANRAKHSVRWVADAHDGPSSLYRAVGAPGEIGSPMAGHTSVRGG